MRNNFRFIFPRLIGATVIVGIAALIITTLFKLLIGVVLIAGVVATVRAVAGRRRHELGGHYMSGHEFGPYQNPQYNGPISVRNSQNVTIVPIN